MPPFEPTSHLVHLTRDGVSLLIETTTGTPNIIHWGAALGEIKDDSEYLKAATEPAPHGYFDFAHRGGAFRENARGFLGRPSIKAHRAGKDWSQHFELIAVKQDNAHEVFYAVADHQLDVRVLLTYRIGESGVIFVDQEIINDGTEPLTIDSSLVFMPLPDFASDVMDFTGHWLKERQPQRQKIQTGAWVRESFEGRSGHDNTIVQLAMTADAGFERGDVWGLSVAWSGNTTNIVERQMVGRTAIGAGENLMPGEVVLGEDESYSTPTVIATYSANGIDGLSDRIHRHIRSRANHPTNVRPRPISLNVWEAVYMNHDLEKLSALADVAAEIGVERFVLDDGWFGARRDDHAGLGDWVVAKDVWPEGLGPLVDKVKSVGLEFGLWFEGEMVNADSDLYRAHPDWILHTADRVPIEARFQQVLDLSHPGAYEHVLGQVDAILNEYDIAYIKWDHNRTLTDASHFGQAAARKQTQAIYRLFDELKARHPGLEIESCASGGGRIDLGMIDHADRFWTSDCNDALERQSIQRYTTVAIPPEMLGTHIGPSPAHSTHRSHDVAFRAITALFGHAGLEWDLTETTAEQRAQLKAWTTYYKTNRELLHSGRVVRAEQSEAAAWTHGVVAQDGSRAIFAYVQLATSQYQLPSSVRFPGLDPKASYRVRLVREFDAAHKVEKKDPEWLDGVVVSGALLGQTGLRTSIMGPEQAQLFEVTRVA